MLLRPMRSAEVHAACFDSRRYGCDEDASPSAVARPAEAAPAYCAKPRATATCASRRRDFSVDVPKILPVLPVFP